MTRSLSTLRTLAVLLVGGATLTACDAANPSDESPLGAGQPTLNQGATTRPIEEFLDANDTGCNFFWEERSDRPSNGRRVFVDYAGLRVNQVAAASLGAVVLPTTFTGTVTERALKDGSAELHVTVHARNALVWSDAGVPGGFAPLFGYRPFAVAAGATPSLADAKLTYIYNNPAGPGAPMQNICFVGGTIRSMLLVHGSGELRSGFAGAADGDPGQISVNQNGVVSRGQGNGVEDGFPTEFVNIKATGN